jgi:methionyl-tRNA formyltransferase
MKTVFMGTPQFAVPALKFLAKTRHKPLLVITQPDRQKGRKLKLSPSEIKLAAQELEIPLFQPENVNLPENLEILEKIAPDVIITVAYGSYLKKKIRNLPRFGCINLHPSLLPRYRGAAPINYALFNGEKKTGISIFQINARMDAGPILWQREIDIIADDNYSSLLTKLSHLGAEDLELVLENMKERLQKMILQDDSRATYSRKLEKKDTYINWNDTAENIHNKVRGLAEFPGAIAGFRNRRIKIIETKILQKSFTAPGIIVDIVKNSGIIIASEDMNLLIKKVQPEGKKIMSASAYDLGARIQKGERFINGF